MDLSEKNGDWCRRGSTSSPFRLLLLSLCAVCIACASEAPPNGPAPSDDVRVDGAAELGEPPSSSWLDSGPDASAVDAGPNAVPDGSEVEPEPDPNPADPVQPPAVHSYASLLEASGYSVLDTVVWKQGDDPFAVLEEHGMAAEDAYHDDCEDCHLDVIEDPLLGDTMRITMVRDTANDGNAGAEDRQRIEIKVATSADDHQAERGEEWAYAWWFKVNADIKNENANFFHLFQIKSKGTDIDGTPQFVISVRDGYLEWNTYDYSNKKKSIGVLADLAGKWLHALFRMGACHQSDGGWFQLVLSDSEGTVLHDSGVESGEMMQGTKEQYLRPKMGLYRKKDPASYNAEDWINIQQIEFWRSDIGGCH